MYTTYILIRAGGILIGTIYNNLLYGYIIRYDHFIYNTISSSYQLPHDILIFLFVDLFTYIRFDNIMMLRTPLITIY